MPPERYEPNSVNAMFARVLERLDRQDADSLDYRDEMKDLMHKASDEWKALGDRVSSLELTRTEHRAKGSMLILIASALTTGLAWFLEHFFFARG